MKGVIFIMKHLYMMLKLACFLDFLPHVTDLLLVKYLHSGASYIYNAHSNTYLTLTYDSNFMA